MYGLVNRAFEELVCTKHGEAVWEEIKRKADVDVDMFISMECYDDEVTYRLVGAASETLGEPTDKLLEAFGVHWVLVTAQQSYGHLMQAGGRTLREFLLNLPNFHSRIVLMMPNLKPPSFRCVDATERSVQLHYRSERPGLTPFVRGLIFGLARMFETSVSVDLVASRAEGGDHDVFLIDWSGG